MPNGLEKQLAAVRRSRRNFVKAGAIAASAIVACFTETRVASAQSNQGNNNNAIIVTREDHNVIIVDQAETDVALIIIKNIDQQQLP